MENKTSNTTDYNEIDSNKYKENVLFFKRINEIGFYILLITVPVGLFGNLISIFIFTRPRLNRKTNTGFLYTIICIFNLVKILYQAIFKKWDHYLDSSIKIQFECETLIGNLILQMLSWIQVLIGFDRFIAVFSPIKGVRIMSKKWVLYLIMFGLFAFIVSTNSPYFIRYSISKNFYLNHLIYINNYSYVDYSVIISDAIKYSTLRIILEVHLPYFIIVVLDILVIVRLRGSKTISSNNNQIVGSNNATKETVSNRTSRFTINTILIDLIYLIVNLPFTICNLITIMNLYRKIMLSSYSNLLDYFSFLFQFLPFIYSSFIFVIFLIFNRIFRAEFLSIGLVIKLKNLVISANR